MGFSALRALRHSSANLFLLSAASVGAVVAAPVVYEIDPTHTFPSFEGDHMGISVWRGKFNRTSGTLTLDKQAGSGSVDVSIDLTSVDFGLDDMNTQAMATGFFDVDRFPTATYRGAFANFINGHPTRIDGELTLHGVTRPVDVTISLFKCVPHPMHQREVCGADGQATFDREAFGLNAGKDHGFDMSVTVRVQAEAVAPP